jgi:pimeloyl-ACP methyl ester carboxylesterase
MLAAQGYHVIVPYFRGYGTTTFLSSATPRDVDQAAFALDILALMDALRIDSAILAGYDWGHGRRTSSRRYGRSAARPWSR